ARGRTSALSTGLYGSLALSGPSDHPAPRVRLIALYARAAVLGLVLVLGRYEVGWLLLGPCAGLALASWWQRQRRLRSGPGCELPKKGRFPRGLTQKPRRPAHSIRLVRPVLASLCTNSEWHGLPVICYRIRGDLDLERGQGTAVRALA